MSQYLPSFRRLALAASIFVLAVSILVAMPAPKAQAAGCHWFNYEASAGGYTTGAGIVSYTPRYTVPSSSTCNDINLASIYAPDPNIGWICANVRVRFYPSSGGSYVNGWKWYCPNRTMVVASDVSNGTKYRLEFLTDHIVYGQVFD